MPQDKHKSQQIGSIAESVGGLFDFALKSQKQFKSTDDDLIDVIDPETGATIRKKDVPGLIRKPGPDYGQQFDDKYNVERTFLDTEQRSLMDDLSSQARSDENFSKAELDALSSVLDREVAKNKPKDVAFGEAKTAYSNGVQVSVMKRNDGVYVDVNTKKPVRNLSFKEPKETDIMSPVDKLDKIILEHREKIEDLKRYPEVGVEEAIPKETRETIFGNIKTVEGTDLPTKYYKMVADELEEEPVKKYITEQEYKGLKKAQENREDLIRAREAKIELREMQKKKLLGRGFKATEQKARTAEDVKADFSAGKITQEEALEELKRDFGYK